MDSENVTDGWVAKIVSGVFILFVTDVLHGLQITLYERLTGDSHCFSISFDAIPAQYSKRERDTQPSEALTGCSTPQGMEGVVGAHDYFRLQNAVCIIR